MERKVRVCIADDDVEAAAALAGGLRVHGYDVVETNSGEAALKACGQGEIDLLLLDVNLGDMTGFDVCERLKDSPKFHNISVIFVTVKTTPEDVARAYELGAVDYITKPYSLPMVMVRVDAALRAKHVHDHLRESHHAATDTGHTDHLTGLRNRRFLMERLQEEVDKAHRYDFPVSCVVFDVDEIEAQDVEMGPVSIDDLLVEVAMAIRSFSRGYDVLARYDGTLFAALLPHAPLDDALGYASKVMHEVEATTFSDPNFPTHAKVSVGIVTCRNGSAKGADWVFGEAMRSLFEAKNLSEERIAGRHLAED